jgi:hypothetical protein
MISEPRLVNNCLLDFVHHTTIDAYFDSRIISCRHDGGQVVESGMCAHLPRLFLHGAPMSVIA